LQGDGNLVFYELYANNTASALWASNTGPGTIPRFVTLQGDGNVVLTDTAGTPWSTGTVGWMGITLSVGNDAQIHLDGVEPYWASGPAKVSEPSNSPPTGHMTTLTETTVFRNGDYLQSQNGEFKATMTNGNLVVTQNGTKIWSSNTGATPATHVAIVNEEVAIPNQGYMMVCGDLQLLDDQGNIWFTAAANSCRLNTGHTDWNVGGSVLSMQNDGNLVLYASLSKDWPAQVFH
jgi:hypothetical protein